MGTGKLRIDGAGEIQFGENPSNPPAPDFGYVSLYSQDGVLKAQNSAGEITIFGSSGTSGNNGTDGTSGTSSPGTPGSSGTSGQNGTSGSSGQSGSSGTSGQNGTSGSSGITGTSGSSGSSGQTGSSGTSGANGIGLSAKSGIVLNSDPGWYGVDSSYYDVVFAQPFGSANYTISALDNTVNGTRQLGVNSQTTSGFTVVTGSGSGGGPKTFEWSAISWGETGVPGTSGTSGNSGSSGSSGQSGSSGSSGSTGTSGSSGTSGANGISSGQLYYFNQSQNSAVSPYKVLNPVPSGGAQQIVTTNLTSLQTGVLVQQFLTPELGFAVIPGGQQTFHLHFLKGAVANNIDAYVTIELANSAGVGYGTILTTGTSFVDWVTGSVPDEVICDLTLPTTTINTTDRMIVKIYLNNLDNQVRSVDFYTEGTSYYSFVITSVGVLASTSGTSGSSGANGTSGSSGQNGTSGTSSNGTSGSSGQSGTSGTAGTSQAGLNFTAVFAGGGAVITPGIITYIRAPRTCTITKVTLLADQTGSAVCDIWKDSYANYPPTIADSICASAKPTLSSAIKYEDSTLTGWTTSVTAGDVLGFYLTSCSTITQITLQLETA